MKAFWDWLRGKDCRKNAEVGGRNLAQTKQVVESSHNRVDRALEHSDRLTDNLKASSEKLGHHLDELTKRMQRLRQGTEERKH